MLNQNSIPRVVSQSWSSTSYQWDCEIAQSAHLTQTMAVIIIQYWNPQTISGCIWKNVQVAL